MAFLAAAAPYIAAGTTVLSAAQQIQAGKSQDAQGKLIAAQQERDAKQANLEAQTEAFNERRKAKLVRSRALAVAGASGAGVDDPGVNDILTNIDAEGEYNALSALYSGEYLARGLRSGASASRREGRAAGSAGYIRGATTALTGAESWYEKYGT